MQKMLIINSIHYFSRDYYNRRGDLKFNSDGVIELNNHLKSGWKVVNMQSNAVETEETVCHICYVVIEKK
ncbi:MAG: hypothetical protein K2G36_07355 [Ruminococcus sp.]|nr:hypothetical protein [Ruminococcus sp.]